MSIGIYGPGEPHLVRVEVDAMKRVMVALIVSKIMASFHVRHHLCLALVSDHPSCDWFD